MALLGLLILVAVALAISAVVFRGGDSVRIDLEWFTINTNAWAVFAAGALTLLMLVLGLWLLTTGVKRSRHRRAEVRNLRKRADANEEAARRASETSTPAAPQTAEAQHRSTDGPDDHFDSAPRER
jgi:uncharacterized protein HemY